MRTSNSIIFALLVMICIWVTPSCGNKVESVSVNPADSAQVAQMVGQIQYDINLRLGQKDTLSFTPYQKKVYDVVYNRMAKNVKQVEGKKQLYLEMTKDEYKKFDLHEAYYDVFVNELEGANRYFESNPNDTVMWNAYYKFFILNELDSIPVPE